MSEASPNVPAFKYDVAFSFLARDEALALEISDLIQDRLATFVYSKRQEQLAGTDGEEAFNSVFGNEARLVVILHRKEWGKTPWTRIEETAIRGRAYDMGFDFVKIIPLDDPATVPRWFPRTQLWLDYGRWGTQGIASYIHARAQELGASGREETLQDRAARFRRMRAFADKRSQLLRSEKGRDAADEEFNKMVNEIGEQLKGLADSGLRYKLKRNGTTVVVVGTKLSTRVKWIPQYRNTLEGAVLEIETFDGEIALPPEHQWETPKRIEKLAVTFDLLPPDLLAWVSNELPARTSMEMAHFVLKRLLDKEEQKIR